MYLKNIEGLDISIYVYIFRLFSVTWRDFSRFGNCVLFPSAITSPGKKQEFRRMLTSQNHFSYIRISLVNIKDFLKSYVFLDTLITKVVLQSNSVVYEFSTHRIVHSCSFMPRLGSIKLRLLQSNNIDLMFQDVKWFNPHQQSIIISKISYAIYSLGFSRELLSRVQ